MLMHILHKIHFQHTFASQDLMLDAPRGQFKEIKPN